MERKRKRLQSFPEDDEEDKDRRRSSLRNNEKVRYNEDSDEKDDSEDEEEEEEEEQEDNEQPDTSAWKENGTPPVSCGNKQGILHLEKFEKGEECIQSENRWFAPQDFEVFGGKGPCKKWRQTIFSENKPLQFWIEQGSITTKGFQRRGAKTMKQTKIDTSESPSEEMETTPRTSTPKETVLLKPVKITIERLPETVTDCSSNDVEHPREAFSGRPHDFATPDSWCKPLTFSDEVSQNEEEREPSDLSGYELNEPSQTSDPAIVRGVKEENGEPFIQINEDGEREIQSETAPPVPATSAPDVTTNGSPIQRDATTSGHDAPLLVMAFKTRDRWATESVQSSETVQCPVSTNSNLDAMDLDQLKREKLKMQIKVLRLQDEYYTLKLQELKN